MVGDERRRRRRRGGPRARAYYLLDDWGARSNACATALSPTSSRQRPLRLGCRLRLTAVRPAGGHGRRRPRRRLDHAHDRRAPDRRSRARAWRRRDAGATASGRRASTPAGIADGRLCERPRAGARARPRCGRGRRVDLVLADGEGARARSPGSGDAPILMTTSTRPSSSSSLADPRQLTVLPRAACSRPATRRRGGSRCPPNVIGIPCYRRVAYGGSVTTTCVPPASDGLDLDRAVELLHALLDRLERAPAPLGLGVVGTIVVDAAAVGRRPSLTRMCVGGPRRDRLVEELADDRVEGDLRRLAEPVRLRRRRRRSGSSTPRRPGRRAPAAPAPKPWSRSTTGSSANERSRSSRIVARWRSSAVSRITRGVVELARLNRVQRPVEHQRDPRELLHRPVVQEQRDPPPLVLLGRDQPVERLAAAGCFSR